MLLVVGRAVVEALVEVARRLRRALPEPLLVVASRAREATGLPQSRVYPVTTSIVSGLTQVTQNIQAAPRGDFRYPWVNLVDLRLAWSVRSGSTRFEPTVDLFNVFDNSAVTSAVTTIGSSLGRPSAIVMGRLVRVGGRITF